MTNSSLMGPCGLTLAQIINLAGGLRRGAQHCGVIDIGELNALLQCIGEGMTEEVAGTLREVHGYEDRQRRIAPRASKVLAAPGVRQSCFAIGWSEGPALDGQTQSEAGAALLKATKIMQAGLGASTSETLDLLVWMQIALSLGKVFGVAPEKRPARQGGTRRLRRAHRLRH